MELIMKMNQQNCETCPVHNAGNLKRLGIDMSNFDFVVALAGNPNTGKSTVFNNLTGLKQHTGNWPGKTVTRAEFKIQTSRSSRNIFAFIYKHR
jgi:ferrous iron transport protein B